MMGFNEVFYDDFAIEDLQSPGEKDHQDTNGFACSASTVYWSWRQSSARPDGGTSSDSQSKP